MPLFLLLRIDEYNVTVGESIYLIVDVRRAFVEKKLFQAFLFAAVVGVRC